jgi:hypothetical protein
MKQTVTPAPSHAHSGPHSNPTRTTRAVEDKIVELRKDLTDQGPERQRRKRSPHTFTPPRHRPLHGDDLADPDLLWVRHPTTPETPMVVAVPLRSRPA